MAHWYNQPPANCFPNRGEHRPSIGLEALSDSLDSGNRGIGGGFLGHPDEKHTAAPPPLLHPPRSLARRDAVFVQSLLGSALGSLLRGNSECDAGRSKRGIHKRPRPSSYNAPPDGGADEDSSENSLPLRLFLVGPSRCGKTSLAMDAAYSTASKIRDRVPCRGCGFVSGVGAANGPRPSSSSSAMSDHSAASSAVSSVGWEGKGSAGLRVCQCVAVTFLAHSSRNSRSADGGDDAAAGEHGGGEGCYFPLRCRIIGGRALAGGEERAGRGGDVAVGMTEEEIFEIRMREIEDQAEEEQRRQGAGGVCSDGREDTGSWDETVLNSIEMKYVSSPREVLRYLAGVAALPPHRRPLGGIVLDDLHLLAREVVLAGNDGRGRREESLGENDRVTVRSLDLALSADEGIRAGQILAFLADAGEYLDDALDDFLEGEKVGVPNKGAGGHVDGSVLVVTSDEASLPPHFALSMARNYLPTLASTRLVDQLRDEDDDDHFCALHWRLDVEADVESYGIADRNFVLGIKKGSGLGAMVKKQNAATFGVTAEDGEEGLPEIWWSLSS